MLRKVARGVWQVDLPLTNAWLLAADGDAILIDTGTRWDRRALARAVNAALPPGFRLRSVLLTHAHCDHAGNAAFLADRHGATICCHTQERPFLGTRRTYVPRGLRAISLSGFLFAAGEVVFPVARRLPDRLLEDGDTLETPVGPLRVIATPGHTVGHAAYLHEKEGWLFSGDALINIIPWIRRPGLCLPLRVFTANMRVGVESAWRIAELRPAALFPGHGPPLLEGTAEKILSFMKRKAPRGLEAGDF